MLVAWRGGNRVYVPRLAENMGPFEAVLGQKAAARLLEEAAGESFHIPKGRSTRPVSKVRVERLARQGLTAPEIARELGCSDRTVFRHRARGRLQN